MQMATVLQHFLNHTCQKILHPFNIAYTKLELKSTQIRQKPSISHHQLNRTEPITNLAETVLENMGHFPHLGYYLSSSIGNQDKVQHRLKCAGSTFDRLQNRLSQDHDIKILMYKAVVIPTLLYASENWKTY